jgi:hypothetical protein
MDRVVHTSWRFQRRSQHARAGGATVADYEQSSALHFTWSKDKFEVIVQRQGDEWKVVSTAPGKLIGPSHVVVYEACHKQAKRAAWDVMACVIRASADEDEGIAAARAVASWMRGRQALDA